MKAILNKYSISILVSLMLLGCYIHFASGELGLSLLELGSLNDQQVLIFKEFRLPKVMGAIISGASISVAGLLMQSYFRNALAGPFVLGVSSGASLGVALFIMGVGAFGWSGIITQLGLIGSALAGSILVMGVIISSARKVQNSVYLLIIGLMWASLTSAIVGILEYFSSGSEIKYFLVWSMGSLLNLQLSDFWILTPLCLLGLAIAVAMSKHLDALLLGKEYAISLGINYRQSTLLILGITCLLAGLITAYVGPLAFVGLAIPHFCRIWLKTNLHKKLIWHCILMGAAFMLWCQWLAENVIDDIVLPINIISSLIGAPVVISIVKRSGQ